MSGISTTSVQNDTPLQASQTKSDGQLKGVDGKTYEVFVYPETGQISEAASEFIAQSQQDLTAFSLSEKMVGWIPSEEIVLFNEILSMQAELDGKQEAPKAPDSPAKNSSTTLTHPLLRSIPKKEALSQKNTSSLVASRQAPQFASVFSLARHMLSKEQGAKGSTSTQEHGRERSAAQITTPKESSQSSLNQEKSEKQKERDPDQRGSSKDDQPQKEDSSKNKKRKDGSRKIGSVQGSTLNPLTGGKKARKALLPSSPSAAKSQGDQKTARKEEAHLGADNLFIRFMALMARILGQAEAEAHELYLRIKHRTDDVDTLTQLMSKINSEKGNIDWSQNAEMKKLLEQVRALGVDIPAGKFTWTEEEKKLLKENIQMRKDSMEKITQLERTDMQRFLQEASQCHQARSNMLKLLKEVMDTIIHNMRP